MVERSNRDAGKLAEAAALDIAPQLKQFLRTHYRLVPDHDDLVQQALGDLFRFLLNRSGSGTSPDELRALAFAILKRRVSDRFREDAKKFALQSRNQGGQESLAPSTETVAGYRELLAAVLGFIAEMDEDDRSLLLNEAVGSERNQAMPPVERKRLSRLREQLRQLLLLKGVSRQDMKEDTHD